MAIIQGRASDKTRKPRLSLEEWRGRNCSKLAGDEQIQTSDETDETQLFEAWLWAERNRWSIGHRCGLMSAGRLDKHDAERALRQLLEKERT